MADVEVQTGFWRDFTKGPITGHTLTLTSSNGALLIAFLAFFIAIVGARSWIVTCFAIHQARAKDVDRDGLYHQTQVLIRNSGGEVSLLSEFFRLGIGWQGKRAAAFRRLIPFIILALVHFAVFTAAGLFSSRISLNQSVANRALIKSYHCGSVHSRVDARKNLIGANLSVSKYFNKQAHLALDYASKCYETKSNSTDCNTFSQRTIDFMTETNATCPFKPWWRCCGSLSRSECRSNPNRAVVYDTGQIDTLSLGHNAPISERITYRRRSTCTPVAFRRSEVKRTTTKADVTDHIDVYVGRTLNDEPYTYRYYLHAPGDLLGYQMQVLWWEEVPGAIKPIRELQTPHGDISLGFLSANHILYTGPSNDPVFRAQSPVKDGNYTLYSPDKVFSAIACIDQHQVCGKSQCSWLRGNYYIDKWPEGPKPDLSDAQKTVATRIYHVIDGEVGAMLNPPATIGGPALKVYNLAASDSLSPQLPYNQWELETTRWFQAALALLQTQFNFWANKNYSTTSGLVNQEPRLPNMKKQCFQQVLRVSGSHQSFSVLGLVITLVLGSAIVFLSFFVDTIVGWVQRTLNADSVKRLQYEEDGILCLQRTAFERTGRGHWEFGAWDIPITEDVHAEFPHLGKHDHMEQGKEESTSDVDGSS